MQEITTEELGAVQPSARRQPRYVTPISREIRLASVGLVCSAIVMTASGGLTWFAATIPPFASHKFAAFHAGLASAWFASVPIGWVLLLVALMLSSVAIAAIRSRRALWLLRVAFACSLLSAATVALVLEERSHVHAQIPIDLRKSTASLLLNRPEAKAQVEKELAALVVQDRLGLWVALVAAAACTVLAVFIAMKSRRPSESPSA